MHLIFFPYHSFASVALIMLYYLSSQIRKGCLQTYARSMLLEMYFRAII